MLTRENDFEDRRIFTDEIDPDGRLHFITKFVKADDMVAMEGRRTSFFNFARKIMKYSEAAMAVLNPGKLHKAFEAQDKANRLDAVRITHYAKQTKSPYDTVINSYKSCK